MEISKPVRNHFVLVHGACIGAWCWYKLKPLLESAGHRVTALDLAASGINTKAIQDLRSLHNYTLPLLDFMASLPVGEKVILVGHSLGGVNLALATDRYPNKVAVAVFLSAFMPDTVHQPSYVLEEFFKRTAPESLMDTKAPESLLDTKFEPCGTHEEPLTLIILGHNTSKNAHKARILFLEDLAKADNFTEEGYNSVSRIYIVTKQDKAITDEFQRWMIGNSGVKEVKEIDGADHMAMLSKPRQLCDCLIEIA